MKCNNCNAEIPGGAKFCNNCGSPINTEPKQIICPNCGGNNDLGSKFCTECGNNLEIKDENIICPNCNAEMPPNSKFCRECGCAFEKWQPSTSSQNNGIQEEYDIKPKEMTWGREFKDKVVADYENEDSLRYKYRNRVTGSKLLNKFTDAFVDVSASAGVLNKSTRNFNSKLIGSDYVEAFEKLTDEEKAVWNAKLGDDDLIWAIRKMDYDDQIRYLPIFVKEVKDIVAAPDYDYVEFFKQVQKGAIKGGFGGLANTWSRQRELEKQIEEYYNK